MDIHTTSMFHYGDCNVKVERWRRNGKTKTWKTRPSQFSIPIKHGLYNHGYIDQTNAQLFHAEGDCVKS